jgi:putative restriction endonuclease
VAGLSDYLELTAGEARVQFRALLARRPVSAGRQVTFLPVETLLCLAASFVVNHRHYGHGTEGRAPQQVTRRAPPAGFEPAHTAPEAVALSPELWGLG